MVCGNPTNRIRSNWTYIHGVCEWHIHITNAFMGSRWRAIADERAKERNKKKRDFKYRVDRLWLRAPHKHCLKITTTTTATKNPHILCLEFFFILTFFHLICGMLSLEGDLLLAKILCSCRCNAIYCHFVYDIQWQTNTF